MIASAVLAVLLLAHASPGPSDVSVEQLLADPASFDGSANGPITVTGEIVGDFQRRGDLVWLQVNGDAYVERPLREGGPAGGNAGIGVRVRADLFDAAGLSRAGGYRFRGPVVQIVGVWHHHDESLGGESYLEASAFTVVERERSLDDEMPAVVLVTGLALLAAGVGVPLLRRLRSAREDRIQGQGARSEDREGPEV